MASYSYNYVGTYGDVDPNFEIIDNEPSLGVLSDGGGDNVFSANEELTNSGDFGPSDSQLLGTVVVEGVTIIITVTVSGYYAWAQVADPDTYVLPVSIPQSSISTANFTTCFLSGVTIATPSGPRPVEALQIGDVVLAAGGGSVPVKWIGRQTVATAFVVSETAWPVLIRAGALGENVPSADLRVTADHALLLDDLLVQAGALVNGHSVRHLTKEELGERYVVYHIETDRHEIVLAEGAPAETFVDNVTRRRFDNYAEYAALYDEAAVSLSEMRVPRIKSARQLPKAIRLRLLARARLLGLLEEAAA